MHNDDSEMEALMFLYNRFEELKDATGLNLASVRPNYGEVNEEYDQVRPGRGIPKSCEK